MKRSGLVCALVVTLLASPFVSAQAQPLSDAKLAAIQANCVSAQSGIVRLQQSEKPTRINRGYLYESILKLMVNFNSRVALNRIDAPELLSITSEYEKKLKDFSAAYTSYDDNLSNIGDIPCREQPTKFYDQLVEIRARRATLNSIINSLDGLLDRYQLNVTAITKEQAARP